MTGTLRSCAAELIGTFALVFAGAGAVTLDALTGGRVGVTGIALAHALAITTMAFVYGPVSGGHFNPAVTAAMLVNRRTDWIRAVLFITSQLLGAALAALLLKASLHGHPAVINGAPYLGACDLSGVGFKAATLLEAVGTFFLVSTIYATTVDRRGFAGTAPIAIGLSLTLGIFAFGPLTGAALNPARAFGPAVVTGHWANGFVYWIGPLAGAIFAALLYENLFLERPSEEPRT